MSTEEKPAIDIAALIELMGDEVPDIIDELLAYYALAVRKSYDRVAASVGDFARLAAAAHAAKGEARTAGALTLGDLYGALETKAKNNQLEAASSLERIAEEVKRVEAFIGARKPLSSRTAE